MSDGQFIHYSVFVEQKTLFLNLVEGKSGVQFVHRTLAYLVVGWIGLLAYKSRKFSLDKQQKNGLYTTLVVVGIQFCLGVFTLLLGVPVWLGLVHQIGAFVLLASLTFTLHRLTK